MVIIIKQYGQLGNRLFPFAQFIAHAKKHNYKLLNPAFEDYSEHFQNTEKSLFSSYPKGIQSRFFTKRVRRIAFRFIEKGVNFAIRKKLLKSWFHEIIIGEPSKHFHSDEKLIKKFKRKFVFVCNPFYFRDEVTMHADIEYVTQFLRIKDEHKKKVDDLIKIDSNNNKHNEGTVINKLLCTIYRNNPTKDKLTKNINSSQDTVSQGNTDIDIEKSFREIKNILNNY